MAEEKKNVPMLDAASNRINTLPGTTHPSKVEATAHLRG